MKGLLVFAVCLLLVAFLAPNLLADDPPGDRPVLRFPPSLPTEPVQHHGDHVQTDSAVVVEVPQQAPVQYYSKTETYGDHRPSGVFRGRLRGRLLSGRFRGFCGPFGCN